MKKTLKTIATTLISICIFGLVPLVLFVFITSRTPIILGIRSFVVLTGSMKPTIGVGSMVFSTKDSNYKVGDIITFHRGSINVTHRIHALQGDKFVTKGDANNAADPELVSQKDIIGKNVFIIPALGKFTGFLKTVPGFIAFLTIPTLIFVFFEGMELKREWEKEIEKKLLKKHNMNLIPDLIGDPVTSL